MRKRDSWGFLELLDHLEKVSDHQSDQAERQNVDFPLNRRFIREIRSNRHFASPLDHFDGPKLFPGDSKSLENPRNHVFASSRYGLKKISSKNFEKFWSKKYFEIFSKKKIVFFSKFLKSFLMEIFWIKKFS